MRACSARVARRIDTIISSVTTARKGFSQLPSALCSPNTPASQPSVLPRAASSLFLFLHLVGGFFFLSFRWYFWLGFLLSFFRLFPPPSPRVRNTLFGARLRKIIGEHTFTGSPTRVTKATTSSNAGLLGGLNGLLQVTSSELTISEEEEEASRLLIAEADNASKTATTTCATKIHQSNSATRFTTMKANVNEETLRHWNEMPQHLQFNPHIRSGYRPLMTPAECIKSIFRMHNETVNILSHGFAIIYILATVPYLLPWGSRGALAGFLSWCHLIGAVSPWIGSFLYHVFMNLNYGESVYRCLLKLDMLGIWICQSIGAMPLIAASVHCLPNVLWHLCIITYCFLSVWGLFKAMNAKSPWERRLCFSPPFMMRMLVLVLRSLGVGGGNPAAFTHVVLQDLIAVIGGTIGAMRIPEKWFPGRVDLLLNSHNIMHVMVVIAVCSMHAATLQDLAWMIEPEVCLTVSSKAEHDEL